MNCPQCHQLQRTGAAFCDACGAPLPSGTSTDTELVAAASTNEERAASDPLIGKILDGKYEILSVLGKGGMGSVYRARRVHIGGEVAVKVLHREFVNEEKTVERFRREARAAALLQHPNVVNIYDYSEARGDSPAYIVMELVAGKTLRKILESEGALSAPRAIALMREICKGVGAAHRLNMVHRDIKPDNIMVLPPDADDMREYAKVVDFGIAKLRDMVAGQTLTQTGKVIGTLYYMSPEQCCAENLDSRSDVYSLGAMFYELLSGRPPFTSDSPTGIVAKHLTEAPPDLPSDLNAPPELDALIQRSLSKEPKDRQNDATEMGRELALLTGELSGNATAGSASTLAAVTQDQNVPRPTAGAGVAVASARPTPAAPRLSALATFSTQALKKINRRTWYVLSGLLLLLVVVVGVAILRRPVQPIKPGATNPGTAAGKAPEWQLRHTLEHNSKVYSVTFSNDDRLLATGSSQGVAEDRDFVSELRIWDAHTGELKQTLTEHGDGILSVAFSPDNNFVATVTGSGTGQRKIGKIKLWELQSGRVKWGVSGHNDFATAVAYSSDGFWVASGSLDGSAKLWDARTGELRQTFPGDEQIFAVAFSPDGRTLASASRKIIKLWDVDSGTVKRTLEGHTYTVAAVTFSHDGKMLASGNVGGTVKLWDTATGELKQTLRGHSDVVDAVAFSPDDKIVASGSYDTTVLLWDAQSGDLRKTLSNAGKVTSVAFSHNGLTLAGGSWDKTVRLWQ